MYTEVGNTENRALPASQQRSLGEQFIDWSRFHEPPRQWDPLHSLPRGFCFWFFPFVFWFFFFLLQSSAANIICTSWRSETKKKKTKTDLKANSSEAHSYLLAGNQAHSQGRKCRTTGTHHNQDTHTDAAQPEAPHCSTQCGDTTRRDTVHLVHLYFPLFWYLLRTERLWPILT